MATHFHPDQQGSPDSISADIAATLRAVSFPANKDVIVAAARNTSASPEVLTVIDGLPEQDYASPNAVLSALGS